MKPTSPLSGIFAMLTAAFSGHGHLLNHHPLKSVIHPDHRKGRSRGKPRRKGRQRQRYGIPVGYLPNEPLPHHVHPRHKRELV